MLIQEQAVAFQNDESKQKTEKDSKEDLSQIKTDLQNLTISDANEKSLHSPSTEYRADIDGLRTIAVGIVVAFHAWPNSLTGGFIGVDVFFVISGYLITQILVKENVKGTFSYFNFYNRRVKRIYPALIVVLLFVLYVGIRYSSKQHLSMITRTMAASTVFGANIEVLTYKAGYWDADVKTNPLLHLWSLGVEEQFYIFWPFLIALLLTKFQSRAFRLLSASAVLSFVLNIVAAYISAKFDFYFPFCRFWQMAVGGLLVFRTTKVMNLFYAHALSTLGLITIIGAAFFLGETYLYPGWWALFPTLASAAIISSGSHSIGNKYFLSNNVMVFFGKISYSLYLWHWPLLVFSRILFPEGSDSLLGRTWFIVVISVVLSLLSYFFVENPIRFRKQKRVFFTLLSIMLLIGITSVLIHKNPQWIKRNDNFNQEEGYQDQEKSQELPSDSKAFQSAQERYRNESIPTPQDYYQKDGRKIPNWSKNKNRLPPTPRKIKQVSKKLYWNNLIFDKFVDQSSKYYRAKLPKNVKQYQVSNEGQQKLVLLYGDSNAHYTAFRFAKLYEDARIANKTKDLPTFVAILFTGSTLTPFEDNYDFFLQWVEEFKPDRIMFIYFWSSYTIYHGFEDFAKYNADTQDKFFYQNIAYFLNVTKNLASKGIEITINSFHPHGLFYSPTKMLDLKGVIQKNVQPVKLSQVSKAYRHLADYLQTQAKKSGAKILNYADHSCYEDACQVISPMGYPVYYDTNHWTYHTSRNWLTCVDFFIQFDKQQS